MRVAILGSTGMLGSALTDFLTTDLIEVWEYNRAGKPIVQGNIARPMDVTSEKDIDGFLRTKNLKLTNYVKQ